MFRLRRPFPSPVVSLLLSAAILGACSDADRPELGERAETTTSAIQTTTTVAPDPGVRRAQALADSIDIYADETAVTAVRQITAAEATSAPGIPIVFLVKGEGDDRLEVYLPVRPNGSVGWVEKDDVEVATVTHRIEVGITEHRIRVYNRDQIVVDEPVGVGRTDRPTPGGIYYLKELLQPPDPTGTYGPYAYGLSGFSTVLSSFNGGEGVIGIHGTNEPDLLGQDVSSGCIRLHNDVITRLVQEVGLPLGTPVEILA